MSTRRKKYARLPSKVDVGRSKPKQFCETSSKIEADSFKTKISCETFQFLYKVAKRDNFAGFPGCRADGLIPMHFAMLPPHLSKVFRLL